MSENVETALLSILAALLTTAFIAAVGLLGYTVILLFMSKP